MILYLDSSALVKLYVDEAHSAFVRRAASLASVRVSHDIAYVECCAAFARRRRDGSLTPGDHARCRRQFDRDWAGFSIVSVTAELIRRAATLAENHAVRAYDSIHLAAAEATARVATGRTDFRFAAFDARLSEVARTSGLAILTPD